MSAVASSLTGSSRAARPKAETAAPPDPTWTSWTKGSFDTGMSVVASEAWGTVGHLL